MLESSLQRARRKERQLSGIKPNKTDKHPDQPEINCSQPKNKPLALNGARLRAAHQLPRIQGTGGGAFRNLAAFGFVTPIQIMGAVLFKPMPIIKLYSSAVFSRHIWRIGVAVTLLISNQTSPVRFRYAPPRHSERKRMPILSSSEKWFPVVRTNQ